ncbi:hypothetical protein [Alistipes indistinctus]|uniref:hypothetical protein n=1 Tax=Alistipes indistinctus TaxID=626932 RepID=UPI00242AC041|nr:hypothetical protein [Alistipes indistinctus]
MKTLELKDICGYLPYGLKYQWTNMKSVRLISMTDEVDYSSQHSLSTAWEWMVHRQARPILRPMSDLTKEITHKGEKFVPLDVLNNRGHFIEFDAAGLLYTVGGCMDSDWLMVFDKFHEWMFDYRGLISAGLAIDVNTLPENPYER